MAANFLSTIQSLRDYPRIVWLLGIGGFINVGGLSLLWPVNAIYIHVELGKPLTVAGLVLMLYSGSGFIGSFVGGLLYDRVGPTPVLLGSLSIAAAVICIPAFFSAWWLYIVVMVAFGVTCAVPFPVMNALVGHAWPAGGRRAFNFLYVANNLGVAVGTAVGGALAEWSFHFVFIAIAVSYTVFIMLVLTVFRRHFVRLYAPRQNTGHSKRALKQSKVLARTGTSAPASPAIPWRPIAALFGGYILAWVIYVQWQCTISVYMEALGYPLTSYSILWTLNGLLIFLSQPLVSHVVRKVPSLHMHLLGGVTLFATAFAVLLLTHQYFGFVAAMVIMTAGELFAWPAVPAAVAELAPPNRLGVLQGLVGSTATFGRMLGPVFGGVLYDKTSVHFLLMTIVLGSVLPFSCFLFYRYLLHHRPAPTGHSPAV